MFPSLFSSDSTLKGLEQTVAFAERRHAILAGNIANNDTPGYKTRDLSVDKFQTSLREMMQATDAPPVSRSARMMTAGLQPNDSNRPLAAEQAVENVRDSMQQVVYHDGSDGNLEMQVTQMAKNQSMHTMAIALLRSHFKTLQMAISESVNV